jgi:hypothetical protein
MGEEFLGSPEDIGDVVHLRVSSPHVIHEAIDGEVIIINLATGNYYSLKGSGAEAWALIQRPAGVVARDLVEALAARFDAPRPELEAAFGPFLDELTHEGLVVRTAETDEPAGEPVEQWRANGRMAFEPPSLEKFTDMQDLVLLDPVHEVDEIGWPHVAPPDPPHGSNA